MNRQNVENESGQSCSGHECLQRNSFQKNNASVETLFLPVFNESVLQTTDRDDIWRTAGSVSGDKEETVVLIETYAGAFKAYLDSLEKI